MSILGFSGPGGPGVPDIERRSIHSFQGDGGHEAVSVEEVRVRALAKSTTRSRALFSLLLMM